MAIMRLNQSFGIDGDSCVGQRMPMTEQDIVAGTEGVYLGPNPENPRVSLYLTYWEADEVAQQIGFPHIAVYQEQKRLLDEQARRIAELEDQLANEVHNLQLEALAKEIRKANKELLGEIQGYNAAVRARIGNGGSNAKPAAGAAKPVGAATAK